MKSSPIRSFINLAPVFLLCLMVSCKEEQPVHLTFEVQVNGEPLEYGKPYSAPNGDGTYVIHDFKLYVSGIKLQSEQHMFTEPESYHLLVFQDTHQYSFTIPIVPKEKYERLQLSIGVDKEGNFSKGYPGDLDPTNQMAWNWTQGYKFILLEGLYTPASTKSEIPLVYHIGFDENKKDLEFQLDDAEFIQFIINIDQLFENPLNIDFHTHPRILFNKEHSAMISTNYADSFLQLKI